MTGSKHLVSAGFRGRISYTPATKDLCFLVLPDAAHIQEEDASEVSRQGFAKHAPALPLPNVSGSRENDNIITYNILRPQCAAVGCRGSGPGQINV